MAHDGGAPPSERARLNEPAVAMQVIDGEAIVIHFARGHYFSTRALGCELLRGFVRGLSAAELGVELVAKGADAERATAIIRSFWERLIAEDILSLDGAVAPSAGTWEAFAGAELEEVELVKYTDLEDLLKLDPIHDVDEAGWPPRAEGTAGTP